jgi:hypothetical protein
MAGAPVMVNSAGSFLGVLDACLINGFGSEAPCGWLKAFSGTNTAAYRSSDTGSTQCVLWVNDTGTRDTYIRGYKDMTDISTGENPYPTIAQYANGLCLYKSNHSTARTWTLFCDKRSIYFFCNPQDIGDQWRGGMTFVDINSYGAVRGYNSLIIAATAGGGQNDTYRLSNSTGGYLARSYTNLEADASVLCTRYSHPKTGGGLGPTGVTGWQGYPAPVDSRLHLWPVEAWVGTANAYGLMPGLLNPIHITTSLPHGTIIENPRGLPGRTVFIQRMAHAYFGAIDITGPWHDDGPYAISGVVTELNVPGAYQVSLHRQSDMQQIKSVWSDASGNYEFTNLAMQKYVVTAIDHTSPLRTPATKADILPS